MQDFGLVRMVRMSKKTYLLEILIFRRKECIKMELGRREDEKKEGFRNVFTYDMEIHIILCSF